MRIRLSFASLALSIAVMAAATPAWSCVPNTDPDPANNQVCLGQPCTQHGTTTMDGNGQNIVACLKDTGGNLKWKAMTTENSKKICSGVSFVGFSNGQPHSSAVHVRFPSECSPCNNPRVITQTVNDSISCGDGSGPINCPNNPATTSTDLHAYFHTVSPTGFNTLLSASDGVWVGAVSPPFAINWLVVCDP